MYNGDLHLHQVRREVECNNDALKELMVEKVFELMVDELTEMMAESSLRAVKCVSTATQCRNPKHQIYPISRVPVPHANLSAVIN